MDGPVISLPFIGELRSSNCGTRHVNKSYFRRSNNLKPRWREQNLIGTGTRRDTRKIYKGSDRYHSLG